MTTDHLTRRRALVAGAASVLAGGLAVARPAAASGGDDTRLEALAAEWHSIERTWVTGESPAWTHERQSAIADELRRSPAATIRGVNAKLSVFAAVDGGLHAPEDRYEALMGSAARDVARLAGEGTP